MPRPARFATLGLALAATASGLFALSGPASAVPLTLTVTTTADTDPATGPCGNSSITQTPDPLSLRAAACLADNLGGAVTIELPAGEYDLTNGTLSLEHGTHQIVTLVGAGSGKTTVSGDSQSSVIQTDAGGTGGNTTVLKGLLVLHGYGSSAGGGGIRNGTGSVSSGERNSLSLDDVTVVANYASGSGAGIESTDSSVSIAGSEIGSNTSYAGTGAGLDFRGDGSLGEALTITATTFDGNVIAPQGSGGSNAGGGVNIDGDSPVVTITDSRFTENNVQSRQALSFGGAIRQHSGTLSVQRSTFSGNQVYGNAGDRGGAIYLDGDSSVATVKYNYISYNYELPDSSLANRSGIVNDGSAVVDATENWWGCNDGPTSSDCDSVAGDVTVAPRLSFAVSASPHYVVGPNGTATVTASLTTDSAGNAVDPSQLTTFDGQAVRIGAPSGDATVTGGDPQYPLDANFSAGAVLIAYDSNTTTGADSVPVTFGQASATALLEIGKRAAFTSANRAGLRIGRAGSLRITTGGGHQFSNVTPTATVITESGALPAGVTFVNNGDGTATLNGNPAHGTSGTYPITLTADNGVGSPVTQSVTLYATTADPTLIARATARHGRTRFGWYRESVTVGFRCVTHGAPLTGKCPSKVVLRRNGAAQSVHATIRTADGAAASATVRGINIDRTVPTVRLTGYRDGATYFGKLPLAHCIGRDGLSGVVACSIYRHRHGHTVHYTVTATDRAGNHARIIGVYYRRPRR